MAQTMETAHHEKGFSLPWWVEPAFTVVALGTFGIYSLWEALYHNNGQYHNYLSPFFSPTQTWGIHILPAIFVLWAPLGFRATCYYYRKEYFRGFFRDPVACGVPERKGRRYFGETKFPWSLNNLHRYMWILAVVVLIFLWQDAIQAFIFPKGFGVGLGSLIMLLNVVLLTLYTFSCHAFRHMVGGRANSFSCADGRPNSKYVWWNRISALNQKHGLYAWVSMFSVWGTDLYIRLLISGVIHDVRFF